MAIRRPWGESDDPHISTTTLSKIAAASTTPTARVVSDMFNFLRIATATKGKKIIVQASEDLQPGAVVMISAASASSELLMATGTREFAGARAFINAASATKGTGSWSATLMYDGTNFRWMGRPASTGRKVIF